MQQFYSALVREASSKKSKMAGRACPLRRGVFFADPGGSPAVAVVS